MSAASIFAGGAVPAYALDGAAGNDGDLMVYNSTTKTVFLANGVYAKVGSVTNADITFTELSGTGVFTTVQAKVSAVRLENNTYQTIIQIPETSTSTVLAGGGAILEAAIPPAYAAQTPTVAGTCTVTQGSTVLIGAVYTTATKIQVEVATALSAGAATISGLTISYVST